MGSNPINRMSNEALVLELVYIMVLETMAARLAGSNPVEGTLLTRPLTSASERRLEQSFLS